MQEINITNVLNSKEYFNESNNVEMAHPKGFEPLTARFVAEYSIQLSYGCRIIKLKTNGGERGIRTLDGAF